MREIAAASDFDFIAAEPRPAKRGAAKRGKSKKASAGASPAWLRSAWRYSTPVLAFSGLVALLAMVAVNAMYLQHGRHPAPLFGATFKIEPPKPAPRPTSIDSLLADKLPAPTPGRARATEAALAPPSVAAAPHEPVAAAREPVAAPAATPVEPAKKSHEVKAPDSVKAHALKAQPAKAPEAKPQPAKPQAAKGQTANRHDAIGALIGGKAAAPAAHVPAPTMMAAQRALQKLGAPVKPNGADSAAMRKAVEDFQRANHLPATGELTAKTRGALAARSGLPVY